MNPESPYILTGTAPAFELAVENALADFFRTAWGTAPDGPLYAARILAGVRDFPILLSEAEASANDPAAQKIQQNTEATEFLKPKIYLIGSAFTRKTGYDQCALKVRLEVNLRYQTAATFAALLSHLRAVMSKGYVQTFRDLFNAWVTTQSGKDYQVLQLMGYEPPTQPSLNAFHGLSAVCEETYHVNGCLAVA